jgi:hypothetical protein
MMVMGGQYLPLRATFVKQMRNGWQLDCGRVAALLFPSVASNTASVARKTFQDN